VRLFLPGVDHLVARAALAAAKNADSARGVARLLVTPLYFQPAETHRTALGSCSDWSALRKYALSWPV
jgi:hypothetical protein